MKWDINIKDITQDTHAVKAVLMSQHGNAVCKNEVYNTAEIYHGHFRADYCTFKQELTVYGHAILYGTSVRLMSVYGNLVLREASDVKSLHYHGEQLYVTNSTLGAVQVVSTGKAPVIYLVNSTIRGDVSFAGRAGKVMLSRDAHCKGSIENGEVEYV